MEIVEAFEILNKYFTKEELESERRKNKLDNSETDTIEERLIWSKLLEKKATEIADKQEQEKICDAAKAFYALYNRERYNR